MGTTTNGNCCGIGDRIPAIFTDKRGFIQVGTQIGNHGNKWKNVNLNAKTWYNLELMQYGLNNKYYFVIKLNGARKWIVENSSPRTFNNVKVWASRASHGFPPADAYIKDLGLGVIETCNPANNEWECCTATNQWGSDYLIPTNQ